MKLAKMTMADSHFTCVVQPQLHSIPPSTMRPLLSQNTLVTVLSLLVVLYGVLLRQNAVSHAAQVEEMVCNPQDGSCEAPVDPKQEFQVFIVNREIRGYIWVMNWKVRLLSLTGEIF